jgi:putative ABC transport system permease protein
MRPLTRKLLRDLRRHRAQFIAVTITIFLGVTIYAASYDSFRNLKTSYEATFEEFRFANLTMAGGDVHAIADLAAEVGDAHLRTVADVPFRVDDTKLLGRMVGLPAEGQPPVNQVKVLGGGYLDPARPDGVLVEEHMADHFDLEPGSQLQVGNGGDWRTVEVIGVVSSPEYIWPARDRQDLITSPDNFGVLFGHDEFVQAVGGLSGPNQVIVYYPGGRPDDGLTETLSVSARDLGATLVQTREEQPSNAALSEDIKGFEETALFFPVLFIAAAAMAAYVMISRTVWAQRPHIGVMLANGMTRRRVLRHYLGYGLVPGLAGALPGAVVGILLARVITSLYTGLLSVPVTLVEFHPATLGTGIAIGALTALAAALSPALFASRVRPAEAMRGETPSGRGRPSLLERVLPPVRRLPIRWRMALRGIGRNPRRTLYTVLGVVLSLMLVLVSWGMIDTVEHLLERQFVDIQQEDASVRFGGPIGAENVEVLAAVPGVDRVEPSLEVPVSLTANDEHFDTALVVLPADTEMRRFALTGGGWGQLPEAGVLLGSSAQDLLDIEAGDLVEMGVGALGISVPVPVTGFLDEPLGTLAYASREFVEAGIGPLPATSALIAYAPGSDPDAVRAAVTDLPEVAAFEDANAIYTTVRDFMVLFYGFVGIMLVFGAAMAFALIFNAMTVNIAERSREVATLLAVGIRRRTISHLITAENLIVAAIGIPLGLVVGYWVSSLAMGTFSSELFKFDLYMRPTTFVFSALAILVVALISEWPGLRALRRLSIPEVVKERST